jgi:hypothetical protein
MTPHELAPGLSRVIRWGGLPVPYVAAWSSETHPRVAPEPILPHRPPAIFRDGRRGLGKPLFGKMDESRVRRVIARGLCQVCANTLPGGVGYVVDAIHGRSGGDPLLVEPLACLPCFRVAVALCPGITRLREGARTVVLRCSAYERVGVTLRQSPAPASVEDVRLNEAIGRWHGAPPLGYLKYIPTVYDVLPLAWLDSDEVRR